MPGLRILSRLGVVEGQFGSHFSVLMSVHSQILVREIGHHVDNAEIIGKGREIETAAQVRLRRKLFSRWKPLLCLPVEGVGGPRFRGS